MISFFKKFVASAFLIAGIALFAHFSGIVDTKSALTAVAFAQETASDAPVIDPPASGSVFSWYVKALSWFGPVFLIVSVVFVMLVVMNWLAINRNAVMPDEMLEPFKERLSEDDFQAAYEVAKESESPLGKILATGLAKMSDGYPAAEQAMSDVAEEEIMKMEQKLGHIAMIASISPMIGLLGTVFGMINSFYEIASSPVTPPPSTLAAGISTALITTQIGLMIAIPAIVVYELFRNKLSRLVLELTVQTESLMSRFK